MKSSLELHVHVLDKRSIFFGWKYFSSRVNRKIFSLKLNGIRQARAYLIDIETSGIAWQKVLKEIDRFKKEHGAH